ncbi:MULTISPECIES: DUF3144 domain-containing protein [unclassified Oleiphilus]|uniref:DUF3144 domain-containing protein n=1 Tax=unclassified Oleiphilus TaxID=2631174 RepID=UPI0007C2D280|nr:MULTISPECIES: DUF3144 domain-containing protein [unclassified Oleiphilus]KZY32537.1 hypothetical protein A3729_07725 [Oleiphilus sp. HI0043]KZZ67586.1 hypothetical protein A3763_15840 [Oleiphilus sp. HI0128]
MVNDERSRLFDDAVEMFLAIAEFISSSDEYDERLVSSAIQYSAARVNALEASSNCDCLAYRKADATKGYTSVYKSMFETHVDIIIENSSR